MGASRGIKAEVALRCQTLHLQVSPASNHVWHGNVTNYEAFVVSDCESQSLIVEFQNDSNSHFIWFQVRFNLPGSNKGGLRQV